MLSHIRIRIYSMEITTRTDTIKIKGVGYYQGKRLFDSGLIKENTPILLIAEPENPYDSNAVIIKTTSSEKLGHVSRKIAAKYQALSKYDQVHSSKIKSITVVSGYETLDIRVSVTYSHIRHKYHIEIPKTPGVYEIKLGADSSYIGSTKNLKKRCSQHLSQLISNIHDNKFIQNDFNKYGMDSYQFSILELTSDQYSALKLEEKLIKEYFLCGKKLYNKTLDGRGISNPIESSDNSNINLIDRKKFVENSKNKNLNEVPSKHNLTQKKDSGGRFRTINHENGDVYKSDIVDGKWTGKGVYEYANGDVYEGDFVDGEFTGKGIYMHADGTVYEGDFVDGKMTGYGELIEKNGDIYKGKFKDGLLIKGRFTTGLGNIYEGNFSKGVIYGEGKHIDPDGEFCQGEFKDWVLNGSGVYTDSESNTFIGDFEEGFLRKGKHIDNAGNIFEGEFDDWTLCGEGKIIKKDGIIIEGEFSGGELDGHGKITSAFGDVIEGDFDDGRFYSNLAVFYAENGEEYIGLFANGMIAQFPSFVTQLEIFSIDNEYKLLSERFSGQGKLIFPNYVGQYEDDDSYEGQILEGEFSEGKLIKGKHIFGNGIISEGDFIDGELIKGKYYDGEGAIFEGEFKGLCLDGRGKINYEFGRGSIYEGVFIEGKLIKGKYTTECGEIYEGEFKNWRLNGKGVFKYANGDIYEGDFVDSEFNGKGVIKLADGDVYEGVFIDGKSIKGAYIENYETSLKGKKKK